MEDGHIKIDDLLKLMVEKRASDLHLRVGSPPVFRIDGALQPLEDCPALTPEDLLSMFESMTAPEQRATFARELELDFAYSLPGAARFRVSVLQQRGTLGIAFRLVPFGVPNIEQFKLPQICKDLIVKPRGLILVTGPTGSGKSTTVAAMIEHLNETTSRNIITIEDPIEFLFRNKKCIIAQRDIGADTKSFESALLHSFRQNPDVIVIGEMRDLNTITTAIRAAETGHLVISTLHTTDAAQTVDRIIDVYPSGQQNQIRLQLSQVLEGVLSQTLLPRASGKGRVAAFEILIGTPAVRSLIRAGKTFELPNTMQLSGKNGMQTLEQALAILVRTRVINQAEALAASSNPAQLSKLLQS
ncbi:MAG: type IV pilus twitching motility protein PilT [Chloroflexota bacterium]